MKLFFSLNILWILVSCAGYQLNDYSNPLNSYGINKLRVEPFFNESNFSLAGAMFADEAFNVLSEFNGLNLTRKSHGVDGVLIGIVRSAKSRKESLASSSEVVAQSVAPTNTSNRQSFNVTATNLIQVIVDYYVVKDKDLERLKAVKNREVVQALQKASAVYHKKVFVSTTLRREIYDGESSAVNDSQTQTALTRNIRTLAAQAAKQLQDSLFYEKRN